MTPDSRSGRWTRCSPGNCGDAGETRTLNPPAPPARLSDPGGVEIRRGLYVDCETTGFSPGHDAVIELGMQPFMYTLEGSVVEVLHHEAQVHCNDPGRPHPAEITHLTGLTDDNVRGERIDIDAASACGSLKTRTLRGYILSPSGSWLIPA